MTVQARLFCLRHGESENVLTGTAGVVPDAPLTPRGRTQAAMAGEVLASESITRIYSSTAIRASATAAIIADVLGVEAIQRPELLEVNIGVAEGSTDPAIRARTAAVLRDWIVERDLSARVADGETGYQVVARVCAALTAIAGNHQDQTVAIVGHVASLTAALNELCKLEGTVWGTQCHAVFPSWCSWTATVGHAPRGRQTDHSSIRCRECGRRSIEPSRPNVDHQASASAALRAVRI